MACSKSMCPDAEAVLQALVQSKAWLRQQPQQLEQATFTFVQQQPGQQEVLAIEAVPEDIARSMKWLQSQHQQLQQQQSVNANLDNWGLTMTWPDCCCHSEPANYRQQQSSCPRAQTCATVPDCSCLRQHQAVQLSEVACSTIGRHKRQQQGMCSTRGLDLPASQYCMANGEASGIYVVTPAAHCVMYCSCVPARNVTGSKQDKRATASDGFDVYDSKLAFVIQIS